MSGKNDSKLHDPRFLLDESLVSQVAEALSLVGYRIDDVVSVFQREGVTDPEIIDWCKSSTAIWINADDSARKHHKAKLQASGIRTLWVYRRKGQMTGREQLRVVSCALPIMIDKLSKSRARHYNASSRNDRN